MKKLKYQFNYKKLLVKFICLFIPFRKARRRVRSYFFQPVPNPYTEILDRFRLLQNPVEVWHEFCDGLDEKSIETVTRSLAAVSKKDLRLEDFLTPDELARHNEYMAKLNNGIFKISDDCYAFGRYLLPMERFSVSVFLDKHGLDTVDLSKIPRDSAILDVGGHIGDSTLIFSTYLDNKIYSFEPSIANFELMKKTITLNNLEHQVTPVRLALSSSKDRILYQSIAGESSCNQSIQDKTTVGQEAIPVSTLEAFCNENNIKAGLIKVDIEGGEQDFLTGARKIIERDKPILLLSIYHSWTDLDYFNIKKIVKSWNLGYKFHIFKPIDQNIIVETLLICEQ